jgi:two-component system, cell cycle response regulator DivK
MGFKVLIADDEPDLRVMLGDFLQASGFQTLVACNGLEALQKALQESPDLLVLDLSMPGMNGWDVAKAIRQKQSRLPIIAFTAHALIGEEEKARAAGCDCYISKPFDFDYLLHEIQRLLAVIKR